MPRWSGHYVGDAQLASLYLKDRHRRVCFSVQIGAHHLIGDMQHIQFSEDVRCNAWHAQRGALPSSLEHFKQRFRVVAWAS